MSVAVLREVRLYGPLRARFGRSHWLAVDSPREAVHALCTLLEGFRDALLGHRGPGYRVIVGEGAQADHRDEHTLDLGAGISRVIRLAPVIHGAKSGWGSIVAGALLLVVAPYAGALVSSLFASTLGGGLAYMAVAGGLASIGKALILGGIVQLLSPQRQRPGGSAEREASYIFNGAVNVRSPGGPVPLIIGRVIVGSVEISAGISTDDIVVPPPPSYAPPVLPPDEPYVPPESY
jgi:predicted phage tail protein